MVPYKRFAVVVSLLGVGLLPFTNCGQYADPATATYASASFVPCNATCITPTPENLSIKVNLGTSSDYTVPANLTEWNLGGDCNEGGFNTNLIRWELVLNGATVRHSGMLGMAGAAPVHSRCVNGRFLLYINLSSIAEDPVNRTGLLTQTGARMAYDLYVEIFGMDSSNDPAPKRNAIKGRTRVSLSTGGV